MRTCRDILTVMLAAMVLAAGAPCAHADPTPDQRVEAELAQRGLDRLRAASVAARLEAADDEDKPAIAEELAAVYVDLLESNDPAEDTDTIAAEASQFVADRPGADLLALRLTLAVRTFLPLEEIAERHRLELAEQAESTEAAASFARIAGNLSLVAARSGERLGAAEARERHAIPSERDAAEEAVAELRRVRSTAQFYAGWAALYAASLDPSAAATAADAIAHFGAILGSPDREPTIDRVPRAQLGYEHVARAVLGIALAHELMGEHDQAKLWLSLLLEDPRVPPVVAEQAGQRAIAVFAAAGEWGPLMRLVEDRRQPLPRGQRALTVADARVLVVALHRGNEQTSGPANELTSLALGDLVARGEIGHVLDLGRRFGVVPPDATGFGARYARAVRIYEQARERHESQATDTHAAERPPSDVQTRRLYAEAADALAAAADASDANRYPDALNDSRRTCAAATLFAGRYAAAADAYAEIVGDGADAESADVLWSAIRATDLGIEDGHPELSERRDALAETYLARFPRGDRAAALLIRGFASDAVTTEDAITTLAAIDRDSPVWPAARRHLVLLLLLAYRESPEAERPARAARFLTAAETLLNEQAAQLRSDPDVVESADAVRIGRQMLAVALETEPQHIETARRTLTAVRPLAGTPGVNAEAKGDLLYRALQLAYLMNDDGAAQTAIAELDEHGGRYATLGHALTLREVAARWRDEPRDERAARALVAAATAVLRDAEADSTEAGVARNHAAQAAYWLWTQTGDTESLDLTLRLDRETLASGRRYADTMRRLAAAAEDAGHNGEALEVWLELMAGFETGSPDWFEARAESLRLLAETNPARARRVLDQLKTLYPSLGPSPWGDQLTELDRSLPPAEETEP